MAIKSSPIRRSAESSFLRRFRLDCSMLSAAGVSASGNEDHCVFEAPGSAAAESAGAGYLFAVIDGASAGGKGGRAARECGSSLQEILDDPRRCELRPDLLLHRLHDANDRCDRFIEGRCAATAVWIWEEAASNSLQAAWAHVGDTRLYHHGSSGWKRITRDHAKGRLLDRAIGQGAGLEIDTGQRRLHPGERLVLLSGGVYYTAPPKSVLAREPLPSSAECVRRLVGQARLNGSRDDTSAIVISAGTIDDAPESEH